MGKETRENPKKKKTRQMVICSLVALAAIIITFLIVNWDYISTAFMAGYAETR